MFRFLSYYKCSVAFEVTVEESNCQLVLVDLWGAFWLIIVLQYDSLSIKRHGRRWSMPFKNAVLLLLSHSVVHDWLWIRKVSSPLLSLSPYIHRSVNANKTNMDSTINMISFHHLLMYPSKAFPFVNLVWCLTLKKVFKKPWKPSFHTERVYLH